MLYSNKLEARINKDSLSFLLLIFMIYDLFVKQI